MKKVASEDYFTFWSSVKVGITQPLNICYIKTVIYRYICNEKFVSVLTLKTLANTYKFINLKITKQPSSK